MAKSILYSLTAKIMAIVGAVVVGLCALFSIAPIGGRFALFVAYFFSIDCVPMSGIG